MSRLKIGLMMSGVLAIMAISASPAFALFEAEKQLQGQTGGEQSITKGGEFVYESAHPAIAVKCPAKSVGIDWILPQKRSSIQINQVKWGKECFIQVGTKPLPATISESQLKVKSPESGKASYTALKGANASTTIIKTELCEITVGPTQELGNVEQKSPNLTSFEETVAVNVTGITATEKPIGVGCGLATKSTTSELKGVEFKLTGQGQR